MGDVTFDMKDNRMEVRQSFAEPWRVTLVGYGDATMTGGRLARVLPYVGDEDFCFTYGDGVADIDIGALLATHRDNGRSATVTAVQPPGRFGALDFEANLVTGFAEKPVLRALTRGGRLHRRGRAGLGTRADGAPRPGRAACRPSSPGFLATSGHPA